MSICNVCGLPFDLCICEKLKLSQTNVKIYQERRNHNKFVVILELNLPDTELKKLACKLKKKLGVGGTVKNHHIELQGRFRPIIIKVLTNIGFNKDLIEIHVSEGTND